MKVNIKEINLIIEVKHMVLGGQVLLEVNKKIMWLRWAQHTCEIQSRERPSIPINQVYKHTQVEPVMPLIFLGLMYTELAHLRIIIEELGFVT